MSDLRQAYCLCGAVRFAATLSGNDLQACHCQQCQRWTGGGPLVTIRATNIDITGHDWVKTYHGSDHGARAFCGNCGTTLYWKLQAHDIAFLPIGLFEDQTGLELRQEIFVDHRPDWLPAWPDTEKHSEAEMLAELNAFLEGEAQ